jgi:hypothetical protein
MRRIGEGVLRLETFDIRWARPILENIYMYIYFQKMRRVDRAENADYTDRSRIVPMYVPTYCYDLNFSILSFVIHVKRTVVPSVARAHFG